MTNAILEEMRIAQEIYKAEKAIHEATKKIEQECKVKVLAENEFYTEFIPELEDEPSERILDPMSDFRMSEEDFTRYCKLVYAEEIEAGLDIPNYNTTADYKTRKHLMEAEKALFETGLKTVPADMAKDLKNGWHIIKFRDAAIDLMLKLDTRKGC